MTFAELLKTVINQTYDVFCPLKIDLGDGTMYKDVREVIVDKGFIIIKLRKETRK